MKAAALAALLLFASALPALAATRYDPRLQFRTIRTEHFVIHFHQGEDRLARRLAVIAEEIHRELIRRYPSRPRGRTHVILVDQSDVPNGWAFPVPYNTIEITAIAPSSESIIGNTTDWLRVVFTHEYTHILHLDRSGGWSRAARAIFGRAPFVFPNLLQPQWMVEGVATYFESAVTGEGRVPAGDFARLVREPLRSGHIEPLDRANGGLVDWPGGATGYAYGAYFHQFLVERFGEHRLSALADLTARGIPTRPGRAFKRVFDRDLKVLWEQFQKNMAAPSRHPEPVARRVTHHGYIVTAPRWSRDGRVVYYSARNPHMFPALMQVSADGRDARRLTSRFLGDRVALADNGVYFDQLELVRNVALQSDLYHARLVRDHGASAHVQSVERLTWQQRLTEPDAARDGTLAAIAERNGDRALVLVEPRPGGPANVQTLVQNPGVSFFAPRWSPDGHQIAAERRTVQGRSEIVLVDRASGRVRELISTPEGRNMGPTWTPDGRKVVFASDRGGGVSDLYSAEIATGAINRLTNIPTGATTPDVSPDGRSIAFVGYTTEGFDIFTVDLVPATFGQAPTEPESRRTARTAPTRVASDGPPLPSSEYSPLPTLAPRFWSPVLEYDEDRVRFGGTTAGYDVLGRHAYGVTAVWSTASARPDLWASYAYDRLRPAFFVSGSDEEVQIRDQFLREQKGDLGMYLPFARTRRTQLVLASFRLERGVVKCPDDPQVAGCDQKRFTTAMRNGARLGWQFSNAKQYGYSVSREDGVVSIAMAEVVRPALGADGSAESFTGEVRAYVPLRPRRAVLALRVAGGTSRGDEDVRRVFTLGGPGPKSAVFSFDTDALGLLRGFSAGDAVGRHTVVANVDYRFPIMRIERGFRTWPAFLKWFHGAVFADAADAFDTSLQLRNMKTSVGAELSLDATFLFAAPVTLTGGIAWRRDPTGSVSDGRAVFFRIGRAF